MSCLNCSSCITWICCESDNTKEFLSFFTKKLDIVYSDLSEQEKDIINDSYISIIQKLHKRRQRLYIYSILGGIGIYIIIFAIAFIPYFLWIISLITLDAEDKASKHVNAIISIVLMACGIIYSRFGFKKKIVIYDQTLMRLKKEGLKFLDKEYDSRYGISKRVDNKERLRKFKSKVDTKIDLAIIKFEEYKTIGQNKIKNGKNKKEYKPSNYNGYGGYFFDINCTHKVKDPVYIEVYDHTNNSIDIHTPRTQIYDTLTIEDIDL